MRMHPDIDLKTAREEACSRLAATFTFLAVYRYTYLWPHPLNNFLTDLMISGVKFNYVTGVLSRLKILTYNHSMSLMQRQ